MLCARAVSPTWAAARNNSGPTWASIPGPDHYADYQRYLTLMLSRYGQNASSFEVRRRLLSLNRIVCTTCATQVDNEDDGLAYFDPQPVYVCMSQVCHIIHVF